MKVLHESGYEAVRVNEVGMATAKDKEILAYAEKRNLVVITADLDFGDILAYSQNRKPSVIIFRLKNPSPDHVNVLLLEALPRIEESLDMGAIVVIEDSRIRIRALPVL